MKRRGVLLLVAVLLLSVVADAEHAEISRLLSLLSDTEPRPLETSLMIVADDQFRTVYAPTIGTMRCYAKKHGYGFILIDPAAEPRCQGLPFFYAKHCAVAEYLKQLPADSLLFVLDADCGAGFSHTSLHRWIDMARDADLLFAQRELQYGEVAAGIYAVRNTRFARMFLHFWASFFFVQPPGFSSADNGAIHQALVEAIGFDDAVRCRRVYDNLTSGVDYLEPYWNFVACTKYLLGPSRRWPVDHAEWGPGAIVLLPFYHSWFTDFANLIGGRYCNDAFPLVHGIKQSNSSYLILTEPLAIDRNGCLSYCSDHPSATHAVVGRWAVANQEWISSIRNEVYNNQLPIFQLADCISTLSCKPATTEREWLNSYAAVAEWTDSPWRHEPLKLTRSTPRPAHVKNHLKQLLYMDAVSDADE